MNVHDINSVGWLQNIDSSIALVICFRSYVQPVFVNISKAEFEESGGIKELNNNRHKAISFYNQYGAGR